MEVCSIIIYYSFFLQTYNQYLNEYAGKRAAYMYNDVSTSHITYDATWTLALALDKADQMIKSGNLGNCANSAINDTLEEWSYTRNTTTSCLVNQALLNTNFSGLSVSNNSCDTYTSQTISGAPSWNFVVIRQSCRKAV